jgi:hypothetical protein
MTTVSRSQLWPATRPVFISALLLFVFTIVVGILNGLDIYDPDHDTLITHVHAGTLGWISLAVSGTGLLMFTRGRDLSETEQARGKTLAWAMTAAITLYVIAFLIGDRMPGDRIQRPIAGTLLFFVVIWYVVWLFQSNRAYDRSSVARLGMILAWLSMLMGAVLGVLLGIITSQNEIPGLADDTAARLAEAHPPAMVIGFLFLAAFSIIEWLIHEEKSWAESRAGATMMWFAFVGGIIINIAFISDVEDLLGPANLLAIAGVGILIWRAWKLLLPSGWTGAGTGAYPRISILFLIAYLVLLTVIVQRFVSGSMDINALQDWEAGLILTFDHVMFIGVMTFLLFGVLANQINDGSEVTIVDKILQWGVAVGIIGFGVGLLTVTAEIKRVFTPIMGIALLVGIGYYVMQLGKSREQPSETPVPSNR